MNSTPEQIREINLRVAHSNGTWIGLLSALLFCLTIGFGILWFKAAIGGINLLGDPHSGQMTPADLWTWAAISMLTMLASAAMGRNISAALLPPATSGSAVGIGSLAGFVVGLIFALGLSVSVKLSGGAASWPEAVTDSLFLGCIGCVVSLPWGIATASLIRNSLQLRKRPEARGDSPRPSGGESLEE